MPCASMICTAACATRWWPKKFSSKLLRSTASSTSPMRPCQAAPAFDTSDVDAAEGLGDARRTRRAPRRRRSRRRRARARRRRSALRLRLRGRLVDVEQRHLGAGRREGARGRGADRAGRAGDRPRSVRRAALPGACRAWPARATSIPCRTCRLRRSTSKRPIASASVMVCDRGFGEVGGDARVLLACGRGRTGRARAPARRAAAGSSIVLVAAAARIVAREIGPVVGDERLRRRAARRA